MTATIMTGLPPERFVSKRDLWRIMISPDDKPGFLRALAPRAPQLEVSGESARRR